MFPLHSFGPTQLESSILEFVCSTGMPHFVVMRSLLTLGWREMNTFPRFIAPSCNTFPHFLGGRGFTADQVGKYLQEPHARIWAADHGPDNNQTFIKCQQLPLHRNPQLSEVQLMHKEFSSECKLLQQCWFTPAENLSHRLLWPNN